MRFVHVSVILCCEQFQAYHHVYVAPYIFEGGGWTFSDIEGLMMKYYDNFVMWFTVGDFTTEG